VKPIHLYEAVAQAAKEYIDAKLADYAAAGLVLSDALTALDAAQDVSVEDVGRALMDDSWTDMPTGRPNVVGSGYMRQARAAIQALGGKTD